MTTKVEPVAKQSNAEWIEEMRLVFGNSDLFQTLYFMEALDRLEAAEAEKAQKDLLLTFGTEQMARAHADFAQLKAENAELRKQADDAVARQIAAEKKHRSNIKEAYDDGRVVIDQLRANVAELEKELKIVTAQRDDREEHLVDAELKVAELRKLITWCVNTLSTYEVDSGHSSYWNELQDTPEKTECERIADEVPHE